MTTVRPLENADSAGVLRINAAAGTTVFRLDQGELARLLAISAAHRAALGADGAVVGYGLAFLREDPYDGEEFLALRAAIDEPFVYVDQIAIASGFRGIGLGRKLYAAITAHGLAQGAAVVCCEVNTSPPNPASLAFHRHLGFQSIGELATRDGRSVVLLRWNSNG